MWRTKVYWPLAIAVGLALHASPLVSWEAEDTATFFVATNGNDAWTGRRPEPDGASGPFATVARAQAAVRAWRDRTGPVRVVMRGGIYYLEAPLEFGPEDSGSATSSITYCAAPGEHVTLSGGVLLADGRWSTIRGQRVWTLDIRRMKRAQLRQLFVNGVRGARARMPAEGEYQIESLPGYTGDFLRSPTRSFVFARCDIDAHWHNLADAEVVGVTRWQDNRLPIRQVEAESRLVTFDRPSLFALHSGTAPEPYWIENVLEGLDAPGEWYCDRAAEGIYYVPRAGEALPEAAIVAPRLERLLRVVGKPGQPVHDLHFENLAFAHAEWQIPADHAASLQAAIDVPGALFFEYAERCSLRSGAIEHVGGYGVEVGVGCADLTFAHNRLADLGAGGIRIGHFFSWETDGAGRLTERGLLRKSNMPQGPRSRNIAVTDNEISHGGRLFAGAVGVFVGDNPDNRIAYNHVSDFCYSGISVGSVQDFGQNQATGNVVEHNHVHHLGQGMLSDLAGIYACSAPGARIRFNRVHDVSRRNYGGWGIYLDEGSHDLLVQSNLVFDCQDGAFFAHHNQNIVAENNIFARCAAAEIERGGIGGFELSCRRNLVYVARGEAIGPYGNERCGRETCAFDRNLYWKTDGAPPTFGGKSLAQWQALGQDNDSLIADPRFVDAERGDFRLLPDSPAHTIGFEPWDLSTVGPRPAP